MKANTEYTPRPWHQVPCTRISPDGQLMVEFRAKGPEVQMWQEFHLRHNNHWALMIDTEVVHLGGFESLEAVSNAIANGGVRRGT